MPPPPPVPVAMRVAVTLGDPAGVGPEIVLRFFCRRAAAADASREERSLPFVVGEARHLEQIRNLLVLNGTTGPDAALARLEFRVLDAPPRAPLPPQVVPVVEPGDFTFPGTLRPGQVCAAGGAAAWASVRTAAALAMTGEADALVTAPLHKEALRAAGCPWPGHTEMLAALAGTPRVGMLLVGGGVRVALATIHEALRDVPGLLGADGILEDLRLLHAFLPRFGLPSGRAPRIGVAGLNPHAGEGGLFGTEERDCILPAIGRARAEGIDASGPHPADTLFHFHREGAFDGVLAMYHDQGLVAVKTLAFHEGVNITMGLPFVRTSVDHGTAMDIAGTGRARPDSLQAAFRCALLLARNPPVP